MPNQNVVLRLPPGTSLSPTIPSGCYRVLGKTALTASFWPLMDEDDGTVCYQAEFEATREGAENVVEVPLAHLRFFKETGLHVDS